MSHNETYIDLIRSSPPGEFFDYPGTTGPIENDAAIRDQGNHQPQSPEVVYGGPVMDLGVRAHRMIQFMDELSHASMLTGMVGKNDPELLERYGGEAGIKRKIASIHKRVTDNMWNGMGYGPSTDEYGYKTSEKLGHERAVRDNFVGPSNQKRREAMRKTMAQYKTK